MSSFRRILINVLQPIVRNIGHVHSPWSHKKITSKDFFDLAPKLKPGHIFVTRTEGELSTAFIPGYYGHAAIYLGNNMVIEAVSPKVRQTDLINFMLTKDEIIVREPIYTDESGMKWAAEWALKNAIDLPYDMYFEAYKKIPGPIKTPVKAFYCSKIVWAAYEEEASFKGLPGCVFEPRATLGEPTITPDDIAKADKKFKTIWKSV